MYLLDTNICIYAMKNKFPARTERLLEIHPSEICVSSVTVGELEYGAAKSMRREQTRSSILLFLSAFTVLPFTPEDARRFGELRAFLESRGTPIGPYDTMIAAQCAARGLTVVTNNTREFERVPNLALEDWTGQKIQTVRQRQKRRCRAAVNSEE